MVTVITQQHSELDLFDDISVQGMGSNAQMKCISIFTHTYWLKQAKGYNPALQCIDVSGDSL